MALHRLTPREREIADLVFAGHSVVTIARMLHVPIATARTHVRNIAVKLANPHGLPALRLIRSYAPVVVRASDPLAETLTANRAASRWATTAAPRPPP